VSNRIIAQILYLIGSVAMLVGMWFYFQRETYNINDAFLFLPTGLSFLLGFLFSFMSSDIASRVDPITSFCLLVSFCVVTYAAAASLMGYKEASASAFQWAFQVSTFAAGFEAGKLRIRVKNQLDS